MVITNMGEEAVAFHRENLLQSKTARLETAFKIITASVSETNEVRITDESGTIYPTFVIM